ncbi:hypothetical protein [Oxobacter pfennigii]|nr:hypothetical protein [Oxobacter pfennigii]
MSFNLLKPDLYIKRITYEPGISKANKEKDVFKSMFDYARSIGVTP